LPGCSKECKRFRLGICPQSGHYASCMHSVFRPSDLPHLTQFCHCSRSLFHAAANWL